jgi:hypothetical protein
LILEEFINHLHDDDLMIGYFQQDGATAHTSNETMGYLFQFFMTGCFPKDCGHPDHLTCHLVIFICGNF